MSHIVTITKIPRDLSMSRNSQLDIQNTESIKSCDSNKPITYTPIPCFYSKNSDWPKTCNLQCGLTGMSLQSIPVFIPIGKDAESFHRDTTEPIFLLPTTACRWLFEKNMTDDERERRYSMFIDMMGDMINYDESKHGIIEPSGCQGSLKRFGGSTNDSQYFEALENSNYALMCQSYSNVNLLIQDRCKFQMQCDEDRN